MSATLLNFAVFQAGWFACVLGAARGTDRPAVLAAAMAVGLRLAKAPDRRGEALLIALAGLLGPALDSVLALGGALAYPPGLALGVLPPAWIFCLWAVFATTFNGCLSWLHGRPVLAAALAAVGAPLSYLAGERLGALTVASGWPARLAIAAVWGAAFPAFLRLAARLKEPGERIGERQAA